MMNRHVMDYKVHKVMALACIEELFRLLAYGYKSTALLKYMSINKISHKY